MTARARIRELERALDNARKDAESISIAYGRLSEEMGAAKERMADYDTECRELRKVNGRYYDELTRLRQSEQRLREALEAIQQWDHDHRADLGGLPRAYGKLVRAALQQVTGEGKG